MVLNGAASFDPERDPLTFVWSIDAAPSGSTAFLRSATEQISFLTADKEGEYVLSLLVQDGRGGSSRDILTVILDNDGDGLIGSDDPDRDGDNVPNVRDAFPDDPGEFIDSDGDGVGNFAELDEDGDGVPDHIDLVPFDSSLSQYPQITETESNDRLADANLTGTTYPLRITGVIQEDSDSDFFVFFASGEDLITATLTKEDPDFHPMLSFADAEGTPLQAIYQFISEKSDAVATISAFIPADGEYLVIVNDLKFQGAADFTYTLDIFRDLDLDTLDDDLEVALGVNSRLADSDGDGLFDAVEVNVFDSDGTFIPDVDGDGVPNWLDFDSDGDGVPDWLEGSADVDGDLLGNFVDLDSDGNGIPDEIEVGPNPILPLDWDGDWVPDFQDIDDDNDGILDANDDNRFQPKAQSDILAPDPAKRLVLETSRVDFGSGNAIEGVARAGDMLLLEGSGFSNIASENLVIFADVNGRTLNLSPSSATATRLEIKVPEIASPRVFVVTGDMRSNGFDLRILGSGSPVLFPRFPFTGNIDTTVTLEGRNFDGTALVNFGGVIVHPLRVTDSSLDVIVPVNAMTGGLTVITQAGISNEVQFKATVTKPGTVVLPPGVAVDITSLTVTFGVLGEATPSNVGSVLIQPDTSDIDYIHVLLPESGANPVTVLLQAAVLPEDTSLIIDSLSTATSLAMQGVPVSALVRTASLAAARSLIRELPEVVKFALELEQAQAADPYVLNSLEGPLLRTGAEAFLAAIKAVDAGLASGVIRPWSPAQELCKNIGGPEITPSPIQFKICLFRVVATGNIGIENDTGLYLSVKITNADTGAVLVDHIDWWWDTNMVGTQSAVTTSQTKIDYNQPKHQNVTVEVITPGYNLSVPPSALLKYLRARTIINNVAFPPLRKALGSTLPNDFFLQLFVKNSQTGLNTFNAYLDSGNVAQAVGSLIDILLKDFRSKRGPIWDAVIRKLTGEATEEIAEKFLKHITVRSVPLIQIVAFTWDLYEAGEIAVGVFKTVDDLYVAKGRFTFNVEWPFEVTNVTPLKLEKKRELTEIKIYGQGFSPILIPFRYEETGTFEGEVFRYSSPRAIPSSTVFPRVIINDLGKVSNSYSPNFFKDPTVNKEGTVITATLPASYLAKAIGPLLVQVDFAGRTGLATNEIEMVDGPRIEKLDPDRGAPGTWVEILGYGFDVREDLFFDVEFTGKDGRSIKGTIVTYGGPNGTTDRLSVVVPEGVQTGPVRISRGRRAPGSNELLFTVENRILAVSTFIVDAEGWSVFGDATGPKYFSTGGNPGGYINAIDLSTGEVWYWQAPPKFLGDVSQALGGSLTFDLTQSLTLNLFEADNVILIGAGMTLAYDIDTYPRTSWTDFKIPLRGGSGWKNSATGLAATQAQMGTVLKSLQALRIRGEFVTGPDEGMLDNVLLLAGEEPGEGPRGGPDEGSKEGPGEEPGAGLGPLPADVSVFVRPSRTSPGSFVTITGTNFKPFVYLTDITIGGIGVMESPAPQVDLNGIFQISVPIPLLVDLGFMGVSVTAVEDFGTDLIEIVP